MNVYEDAGLFPYLSGEMLQGREVTLTIRDVRRETVTSDRGSEQKLAVVFQERPKPLLLNKTNAKRLAKLFGPETTRWTGQRVTLYPEEVKAFGEMRATIRVKAAQKGAGGATAVGEGDEAAAARIAALAEDLTGYG